MRTTDPHRHEYIRVRGRYYCKWCQRAKWNHCSLCGGNDPPVTRYFNGRGYCADCYQAKEQGDRAMFGRK